MRSQAGNKKRKENIRFICLFLLFLWLQAAPRDALISDLAPLPSRSACFGFAQAMRKWGSFVGAGLSFFLMKVRWVSMCNVFNA